MVIIVAIVVIGPKDLPRALYKLGQLIGKAKGVARHFRTGVDAMVREVELEEMEKKWKADNERIMREHAALAPPATAATTTAAAASDSPDAAPAMQPLPPTDPAAAAPAPAPDTAGAKSTTEAAPPAMPATEGER